MRFLHTADWHVGRGIRGRSRLRETEAALQQMIEIARAERVEAILVCGDIWDTPQPTPDAERVVNEVLRECVGHGFQVVLLAGNHDSRARLGALGLLSELLGVYVQSQVVDPDAGGVINIEGRDDILRVAAVPFVFEGELIKGEAVMGRQEDWFGAYADRVAHIYRWMCAGMRPDTVNVLAAHVFVDGAQLADIDGSERLLHIGRAYGIQPAALPEIPQYIALGHIHQPQEVVNAPVPTAYSGSLLQLDFGEREQQKVVRIVDARPGLPVEQRLVPITAGTPLVELRGTLPEVVARREALGDAHVRVVLEVERPEPGLAERVREQVGGTVDVRLAYERDAEAETEVLLGRLAPVDLFARYYRQQHGAPPAPQLLGLFNRLYEEATGEPPARPAGATTGRVSDDHAPDDHAPDDHVSDERVAGEHAPAGGAADGAPRNDIEAAGGAGGTASTGTTRRHRGAPGSGAAAAPAEGGR